jgi:hypothetical protein
MSVTEILEQTKALSLEERKELAKLLIDLLDAGSPPSRRRLSELRGLGKGDWTDSDANAYVDHLRDEWDDRS